MALIRSANGHYGLRIPSLTSWLMQYAMEIGD